MGYYGSWDRGAVTILIQSSSAMTPIFFPNHRLKYQMLDIIETGESGQMMPKFDLLLHFRARQAMLNV